MEIDRANKLIPFMVMGDGGLYLTGRCTNARFIMNIKKENLDYVLWVQEAMSTIASTRLGDRKDYNVDGCTRQPQVRIESRVHSYFSKLHEKIYKGKYKGLDKQAVTDIDWETLAILFMCDGSSNKYLRPEIGMVNPSCSVTLNMKRLTKEDMQFLCDAIEKNLDVKFSIHRQNTYFYMSLPVKYVNRFMDGIEEHVKDSFKYKIVRMYQ